MATLTQTPDSLSLSRNIKDVVISSSSEVRFRLKKGTTVLLDENYQPDSSGQITIDIRDVVTSSLSIAIPTSDSYEQTGAVGTFEIYLDSSSSAGASFTAVLGGVSGGATASTFLPANFLTWQAQEKDVTADQPEWLTYYFTGAYSVKAKFYNKDGTDKTVTLMTGAAGKVYSINCQFSHLWALGATTVDGVVKERYGFIDVWVDNSGTRLTYVQRYCFRRSEALDEVYLCQNSIGGIDTFLFTGEKKLIPDLEHTVGSYDNTLKATNTDTKRRYSQNTGLLKAENSGNLWDFFRSLHAYYLKDGTVTPIVLDSSTIEYSGIETANSSYFEYRISDDDGLLKVQRSVNFPTVIEIPGPDQGVYYLAPRVVDYPESILSDELLLLVQSPYLQAWKRCTIADLKTHIRLDHLYQLEDIPDYRQLSGKYLKVNTSGTLEWTTIDAAIQGTVTLESGTNNGTLKLTVGSAITDNIPVAGLGSLAYKSSLVASDIPSLDYLPLSGGTLTGALTVNGAATIGGALTVGTGLGINDASGHGLIVYHPTSWTGVSNAQWGCGAAGCQGVIRSDASNLIHYKGGTNHIIYDAGNCNSTSVDWSCKGLTMAGALAGATNINASGRISAGTAANGGYMYLNGGSRIYHGLFTANIISSSYQTTDLYLFTDGALRLYGGSNIVLHTNAVPITDNTLRLGADGLNFAGVHTRQVINNTSNPLWIWEAQSNAIRFATAATERAIIDASGNVGIGTSAPSAKLTVFGDTYFQTKLSGANITVDAPSYTGGWNGGLHCSLQGTRAGSAVSWLVSNNALSCFRIGCFGATYDSPSIYIDSSRNVGIGITSPGQRLDVVGTLRLRCSTDTTKYIDLEVTADGNLKINGNVLTTGGVKMYHTA